MSSSASEPSAPHVHIDQLTKRYGQLVALDGCSLDIQRGEVFGLLGPNGAGKTTLLRLLMGFLRPTAGVATIDGLDCYHRRVDVHRGVAYMPGEARLFRTMRGRGVLQFFTAVRGERLDRGLDIARRLDLNLNRWVGFMSTGMRQKLALAVALSADVPLVILDEPTSNLDPNVRGVVLRLVNELRAAGRTVLFSSHVLSEVEDVADRVAILRGGRLVHVQSISELRRQHCITAVMAGPLDEPPPELRQQVRIQRGDNGHVQIYASNDLPGVLRWLAQIPLRDIAIQPVGLRGVYDQFHEPGRADQPEVRVEL